LTSILWPKCSCGTWAGGLLSIFSSWKIYQYNVHKIRIHKWLIAAVTLVSILYTGNSFTVKKNLLRNKWFWKHLSTDRARSKLICIIKIQMTLVKNMTCKSYIGFFLWFLKELNYFNLLYLYYYRLTSSCVSYMLNKESSLTCCICIIYYRLTSSCVSYMLNKESSLCCYYFNLLYLYYILQTSSCVSYMLNKESSLCCYYFNLLYLYYILQTNLILCFIHAEQRIQLNLLYLYYYRLTSSCVSYMLNKESSLTCCICIITD